MGSIFFTADKVIFIVFVLFVISVFACFYIFADSQKRRMNTKLWVFLAAVFHVFALIAYSITKKPKCTKIDDEFLAEGHKKSSVPALLVSIFVCLLATIMNFVILGKISQFEMRDYYLTSTTISMETVEAKSPEIAQWIEECNQDEDNDVFVLRNDNSVGELVYTKGWIGPEEKLEYSELGIDSIRKVISLKLPAENSDSEAYNITYFKTISVDREQYYEDDCYKVWGDDEKEIVFCDTVADIDVLAE